MQQVLFRIPLKVDWLPFPLWVLLLVLFLAAAGVLYFGSRFAPRWKLDPKSVQSAALWVGVAGLIVTGLAFYFAGSGLPIYGFGMMLFLAFVVCNWLAGRRAVSEGVPKEVVQDLAIWLIVGGLIGARLASLVDGWVHGTFRPTDLSDFVMHFISIWDGGIILYGAVIGGTLSYAVAYFLVFRKQGLSTLKLADIIAPALAVGLCLGRIGCFLNGCCYGQVACTDCPVYAVSFPLSAPPRYDLVNRGYQTVAGFTLAEDKNFDQEAVVGRVQTGSAADRAGLKAGDEILDVDGTPLSGKDARYATLGAAQNLDQYLHDEWPRGKNDLTLTVQTGDQAPRTLVLHPWTLGLHPTQLYESISMILLFLLLTAYYPFRRHDGQVMALLMICYAVHRYLNELLRADERPVGFESYSSVILLVAGVALWVWLQTRPAQYRFQVVESRTASTAKAATASQAVRPASS